LAHQVLFKPDFGLLNLFDLEFGPLAKKVGHPWSSEYQRLSLASFSK
jgi:hypothetical protein